MSCCEGTRSNPTPIRLSKLTLTTEHKCRHTHVTFRGNSLTEVSEAAGWLVRYDVFSTESSIAWCISLSNLPMSVCLKHEIPTYERASMTLLESFMVSIFCCCFCRRSWAGNLQNLFIYSLSVELSSHAPVMQEWRSTLKHRVSRSENGEVAPVFCYLVITYDTGARTCYKMNRNHDLSHCTFIWRALDVFIEWPDC